MMITLITSLILFISTAKAEEVKADDSTLPNVLVDNNSNEVRPTYKNVDNTVEKSKEFSWGTVYYSSVTRDDDHDHSAKEQTHLNIRYVCKNAKSQNANVKRFAFCGYATSKEDIKARELLLSEMKKLPEHKGKTDAELNALYDQEYNNRIVDPVWNIHDKTVNGKVSVEITVRQNIARFGSCEEKISNLALNVDCK